MIVGMFLAFCVFEQKSNIVFQFEHIFSVAKKPGDPETALLALALACQNSIFKESIVTK